MLADRCPRGKIVVRPLTDLPGSESRNIVSDPGADSRENSASVGVIMPHGKPVPDRYLSLYGASQDGFRRLRQGQGGTVADFPTRIRNFRILRRGVAGASSLNSGVQLCRSRGCSNSLQGLFREVKKHGRAFRTPPVQRFPGWVFL